jgi:hypothetical protein
MRRLRALLILSALLALALAPAPVNADRTSWNNWHVHDGTAVPYTDATGLTHRAASIFPTILGVSSATYIADPSLWAYCTDATDKSLVGGDGGAKGNAGHCQNDSYIIHLQGIAAGDQVPNGWTAAGVIGGYTIYYKLTPR